jgi:putative peptidoglycan lipid II flippase
VMFAPQVWLYGLAVVSAGVLQAHHRFLAAAAAPLLSSVVVIIAYLATPLSPLQQRIGPIPADDRRAAALGWYDPGVLALAACTLLHRPDRAAGGPGAICRWRRR